MDKHIKQIIKENLKKSIRNFFKGKKIENYQVLDDIFPKERRIRSLIGGLVPQGGSQKSKVKSQNEDSIGFLRI